MLNILQEDMSLYLDTLSSTLQEDMSLYLDTLSSTLQEDMSLYLDTLSSTLLEDMSLYLDTLSSTQANMSLLLLLCGEAAKTSTNFIVCGPNDLPHLRRAC